MFYEFILSNSYSIEPQHNLEDSYIPIFALMCTMKHYGLQLLKCSSANRFC